MNKERENKNEEQICRDFSRKKINSKNSSMDINKLQDLAKKCSLLGFEIRFDEETLKKLFLSNPSINPETGRKIEIGKKKYLELVEKYGEPGDYGMENVSKNNIIMSNILDDVEDPNDIEDPNDFEENNQVSFRNLINKIKPKKKIIPNSKKPLFENEEEKKKICTAFLKDKTINPITNKKIDNKGQIYKMLMENCKNNSYEREKNVGRNFKLSNKPLLEEIRDPFIINSVSDGYDRDGRKLPPKICSN